MAPRWGRPWDHGSCLEDAKGYQKKNTKKILGGHLRSQEVKRGHVKVTGLTPELQHLGMLFFASDKRTEAFTDGNESKYP